jgi:hypothetical protein
MKTNVMIKFTKYLANRLNFKLDSNKSGIYIYYNEKKDMELDIDHMWIHLFIYDSQKISNIYYNIFVVNYLAEMLGYDNAGRN